MRKTVFVTLAMALVPLCAFAVDGIVLINQSTVDNAGGFPYTISTSGSYKLSGNLTVTTPNTTFAIIISAPSVTIDLNGFTITTTQPCDGCHGIRTTPSVTSVTIRNGSILNFSVPVFGTGALATQLSTLENLTLMTFHPPSSAVTSIFTNFTRISHVIAPAFTIYVSCPSVVTETAAYQITALNGFGSGTCAFANNATVQ